MVSGLLWLFGKTFILISGWLLSLAIFFFSALISSEFIQRKTDNNMYVLVLTVLLEFAIMIAFWVALSAWFIGA